MWDVRGNILDFYLEDEGMVCKDDGSDVVLGDVDECMVVWLLLWWWW